jgi:hypothetical protein
MLDDSSALNAEPEAIQFHGEALARDVWARTYGVWIVAGFVAIFACFLIAMNLAGQVPGKSFALKSISDVFQFVGEGIGCFFCVRIALRLRKVFIQLRRELMAKEIGRAPTANLKADRAEKQAAYRGYLAWTFLAIAIALYVAGQIIWTSYDVRMNSADVPFPGLYDLGFVTSYAFFLAGTLLLTRRGERAVSRTYLLLDALAIIGAALALSWFFLLGPSISGLPQAPSPGAAFLSLYFPTGDLFLVAVGAFLMFSPLSSRTQQPVFLLLCSGLFLLAITDSLLSYYNFLTGFNTGTLQDVLWPVSMQLIGLAAIAYPYSVAREQEQKRSSIHIDSIIPPLPPSSRISQLTAIALAVLPLMLVLMTCALLLLRITPRGGTIAIQSNFVVLALVLILIARQALTLLENNRLITQIQSELMLSQRELYRQRRDMEEAKRRAQEKQELEEGVAALRSVLTRVARGDYSARVLAISGPLQQIAVILNTMLDQLNSNAHQSAHYKQLTHDFRTVQDAIERFEQGLPPWTTNQPPSQCTAELRAIFLGLLHVHAGQTNQWRNLRSSLDSNSKLIRHLRETLSKIRYSKLFSQSDQQLNAEGVVLDLAISEATILEQQHQHVVDQVPRTTSTTTKMAGLNNISQSGK